MEFNDSKIFDVKPLGTLKSSKDPEPGVSTWSSRVNLQNIPVRVKEELLLEDNIKVEYESPTGEIVQEGDDTLYGDKDDVKKEVEEILNSLELQSMKCKQNKQLIQSEDNFYSYPEPGVSTSSSHGNQHNMLVQVKKEFDLADNIKVENESPREIVQKDDNVLHTDGKLISYGVKKEPEETLNSDLQSDHNDEFTDSEDSLISYPCSSCNKSFPFKSSLDRHMLIHTKEKQFSCDICNNSFGHKSSLVTHLLIHSGEKPFKCSTCDKRFGRKEHLMYHEFVHSGNKPFSCPSCDKTFVSNSKLQSHKNVHSGLKPFSCSICNKSYTRKNDLANHRLFIHYKAKAFWCSICNKGFGRKSQLSSHMLVHTGVKPFKCSICNKTFSNGSNLKKHEFVHTGEKPFTCSFCNKSFNRKAGLSRHVQIHYDD